MPNSTYTKKPLYLLSVFGGCHQDPITFTSSLYPFLVTDNLNVGAPSIVSGWLSTSFTDVENLHVLGPSILSGILQQVAVIYNNEIPDVINVLSPVVLSGVLQQVAVIYNNERPDEIRAVLGSWLLLPPLDLLHNLTCIPPDNIVLCMSVLR